MGANSLKNAVYPGVLYLCGVPHLGDVWYSVHFGGTLGVGKQLPGMYLPFIRPVKPTWLNIRANVGLCKP